MNEIETYLTLPLGERLAEGNWESHVYTLGVDWVYKEIKSPESLDSNIENYKNRKLLQEFWNSDTHFQNMQKDYNIFKLELNSFIPDTLFCKHKSLLDGSPSKIISVQKRLYGKLLKKEMSSTMPELNNLATTVKRLCEEVFHAPPDFHTGNVIMTNANEMYFFDTGTPSDWEYFLDAEKFSLVTNTSPENAQSLVDYMKPIHELHWKKLIEFSE